MPANPTPSSAVKHPHIVSPIYMSDEEPRNTMEGRARRRASPGTRTKPAVRPMQAQVPPPSSKRYEPGSRMPVVYYLCRNRQLEHPHFMEVTLQSPRGIYLRDVISRLDALRGNGMAARYSWSCKRSYKNGFVWHDLSEDDLLLPAQGSEYVLKGSELLLDQSMPAPDHQHNTGIHNAKVQCPKLTQPPVVSVIREAPQPQPQQQAILLSSPSASTIGDDEQCRTPCSGSSGSSSPKTRGSMSSSGTSSPSLTACKMCTRHVSEQCARTQANGKGRELHNNNVGTCTDNEVGLQQESADAATTHQPSPTNRKGPEIQTVAEDDSPAGVVASAIELCSSGRDRSGTLEFLIREEADRRGGSARILEEDERSVSSKPKPGNMLMRLIACGSMSVKNHPGFGIMNTYKPKFTQLEFPSSPVLSPIRALRHHDHTPASTPTASSNVRVSETERSSEGLLDLAGVLEEPGKLKRSSSYNQARFPQEECSVGDSAKLVNAKTMKMVVPCEQPRSGTLVSITRDIKDNSGEREGSRSSGKIRSSRVVSFHDEKEKAANIEEK